MGLFKYRKHTKKIKQKTGLREILILMVTYNSNSFFCVFQAAAAAAPAHVEEGGNA